ncbi:EGF-like domain-containing protein, partial [Caerostris darwini]
CDCGEKGACSFINEKVQLRKQLCEANGVCKEDYTISTMTTKQETTSEKTFSPTTSPTPTFPTSTPRSCECGRYSRSCRFDYFGRQVCECYPGYVQINNYCYEESTTAVSATEVRSTTEFSTTPKATPTPSVATTEKPSTTIPTTTLRDCYCGMNSRSCRLNWFGRKMCDCYRGYEQVDGYCLEICNDDKCLYGKCQVIGYGYECRCNEGYTGSRCEKKIQPELGNQMLRWVIQVSFAAAKWSLQKHFNEDSSTPAADMNSTVKVLLLIVCILVYASIAHCASVSKNSIEENQTDIHSIHSNYQLAACDCGTGANCTFDVGFWTTEKYCLCPDGTKLKNQRCKACDCGRNGQCSFVNGAKKCECDAGFLEDQGTCRGCDCGNYSYSCYLDTMNRKLCLCHFGYVQMNGYCYEYYTTSTVTTIPEVTSEKTFSPTTSPTTTLSTSTPRSCDCGKYSHSCYLDTLDRKLCLCHFGYVQMNGYCYAATTTSMVTTEEPKTTTPTTTLRGCDCGKYSYSCYLDTMERKLCLCHFGYVQMNGYCYAATTTSAVTTEGPSTAVPRTTLRDCYCGINSRSCLNWFGRKICDCYAGYDQIDGYCLEICNDDKCLYGKCQVTGYGYKCRCYEGYTGSRCEKKIQPESGNQMLWRVIQVSLTGAVLIVLMGMSCFLCRMKK